jgi:drug/metabolite transporter (DMT)-like permease
MLKDYLYLHFAILMWGGTAILGRFIELDALNLVIGRMLIAWVVIAGMLRFVKTAKDTTSWKERGQIAYSGILMALHWLAFFASIKLSDATTALVCMSTASLFTAIFNTLIRKEPLKLSEVGVGSMALLGVCVIALKGYHQEGPHELSMTSANRTLGIVMGMLASILCGWFAVLNKGLSERFHPLVNIKYLMASGALFLLVIWGALRMVYGVHLPNPSAQDWLGLAVLAIGCTALAQWAIFKAYEHLSAFTISLSVNLEPVYGVALAMLIFKEHEQMTVYFYLGAVLIMLSVVIQTLLSLKKN